MSAKEFLAVLAGVFFFFIVSHAMAESYTFRAPNGDRLTLTDKPCSLGGWFKQWKAASMVFQGKDFKACWKPDPSGQAVFVVDSAGDVTMVPAQLFSKDEAV